MEMNWKKVSWNVLGIVLGSFMYACGISLFLDPNNLAPGGLIGIAVILNRLLGLETGTLFFLLNIPVVCLGLWKFGPRFIGSTFFAIAINSVFTNDMAGFGVVTTDPLLASLAGSILVGAGIAFVFRSGATTGGIDIIIKIIRMKYKHLKTGHLFLSIDIVIVVISGFVFQDFNIVMYALIAVVVSGRVIDYVLYGGDEAKLIYVISDHADQIADRILKEMSVGATFLKGQGAFTGNDKKVILCAVRKNQSPKLEEIVKSEDKKAFLIISSAHEIYGEGYKDIYKEKL
ncbi:MAG TPA: YitT family protein [Candidatus Fimousia stercorigallinarum]|nr:YitT family protein [Candidatus Fimousia stercorigallinarum]